MKIRFDPDQGFQNDAVGAVCNLLQGQPLSASLTGMSLSAPPGEEFTDLGIANKLVVGPEQVLSNLREIQARNGIEQSEDLDDMHFSVEMETGTGKTYVYLKTIFKLNQDFGFKKFVLVVPSIAIKEGTLATITQTKEHFGDIFGYTPVEAWPYDSKKVARLRNFAVSNQLQLVILTIDSFNKASNVINRENEALGGHKPIEFVSSCRPIVILDEPQNLEGAQARAAIASLNPSIVLRYSATHRFLHNLVYRLDPVRAYDLGLVKRIEVDSVAEESSFNHAYLKFSAITTVKRSLFAKVELDVRVKGGVRRQVITLGLGADLYQLSGGRSLYKGYVVDTLDAASGLMGFSNGICLSVGESQGMICDELMKVQIRETVREHLEKELRINKSLPAGRRIKVLSLFFIDRVVNYVSPEGKIRRWFEEAYSEMAKETRYSRLVLPDTPDVHGGYFAQAKGRPVDTSGTTDIDEAVYALIMKDKVSLLKLTTPLRFIFSHSALSEGWDNPNIFQICTLRQAHSEVRKRQEIGRGLRLPVDEQGERCFDSSVNRLTVIANESYDEFARALQTEIMEECGVDFVGRVKRKRDRCVVRLKKGWETDSDFVELWDRIKSRTRYSVALESSSLVSLAISRIQSLPNSPIPKIAAKKAEIVLGQNGLETQVIAQRSYKHRVESVIPDMIGYLQRETELTRETLSQILMDCGRLQDALLNPQWFMDSVLGCIRSALQELMVFGVKYERIANHEYEMQLFEEHEIEGYLDRMIKVSRSIVDQLEYESDTERKFAEELDVREDIRLFVKLPRWFRVETPLGSYNPDWAIVKEEDGKVYLIRETKSTIDPMKLRAEEVLKIQCGKAHFMELGVDFKTVTSAKEV